MQAMTSARGWGRKQDAVIDQRPRLGQKKMQGMTSACCVTVAFGSNNLPMWNGARANLVIVVARTCVKHAGNPSLG
eukprot:gene22518-biopygen20748